MINKEQTNFSNASNEEEITRKTNLSLQLGFVAVPLEETTVSEYHEVYDAFEGGLREQLPSGRLVETISIVDACEISGSWILSADIDFCEDVTETDAISLSELLASEFRLSPDLDLFIENRKFVLRDEGSEAELRRQYL